MVGRNNEHNQAKKGWWWAELTSWGIGGTLCDEKTVEYLRDLIAEKQTILSSFKNRQQVALESAAGALASGESITPLETDIALKTPLNNGGKPKRNVLLRLLDQGKRQKLI